MPETKWLHCGLLAAFVALLLLIPQISFGTDSKLNLLFSVFTIASLAASWNILAGFAGQISLGHVAFFGLGSLVTRELWLGGFPLLPSVLVGGLAAAGGALIVGAPALRLKGIYFSIGTLAAAEALRLTVGNALPKISRLAGPQLRAYELAPRYYLSLAVLLLIVAITYWLSRSKLGLGMMAVREDEDAARAIGINVFRHTMTAFVLSAFLAGLAGGTSAFFEGAFYHNAAFRPVLTFDALIVTFVGGIGTLAGPLVGAAFFVLIRDELASSLVNIHLIIFGIAFIIVVLLLPGGILEAWGRGLAFLRAEPQLDVTGDSGA